MTDAPIMDGARVLVVGASSGIGRAVAVHAARAGARVCGAARRTEALDAWSAEVGSGHPITADVMDPDSCRRLVTEAVSHLGGLDLVVYAAGVGALGRLEDADSQTWQRDYAVNVIGPTLVCGAALPFLASHAVVSFMSSEAATETRWGLSSYAATKAALDATVRSWRVEHPERRFQRIVMGATVGTDFGTNFDLNLLTTGIDRWQASGVSLETMDADDVGQQLVEMFAVMLAHPAIDVPDLCFDPRGTPWPG